MSSIADLAWAAGIIDGEGCIILVRHKASAKRKTDSWLLRVDVGNCDARMLKKLLSLFGGHVVKKLLRSDKYMPQWRWYCNGPTAVSTLNSVLPYLVCKREQAEVALLSRAYLRGKHESGNNVKLLQMEQCGNKLRTLKRDLPSWESVNVIN